MGVSGAFLLKLSWNSMVDETITTYWPENGPKVPYPHLRKAPISEALIDIQVNLPDGSERDLLDIFCQAIKDRYPIKKERHEFSGQFKMENEGTEPTATASKHFSGYLLTSQDGLEVAQGRLDGFTFSRLYPYQSWEELQSEAKRIWEIYVDCLHPTFIKRIAVRYINKIVIPVGADLRDYLATNFDIAPNLPQNIADFLLRVVLPFPDEGCTAIISQTFDHPISDDRIPLIFDIDVFQGGEPSIATSTLWEQMDQLRLVKNRIFFESIQDKAIEEFK